MDRSEKGQTGGDEAYLHAFVIRLTVEPDDFPNPKLMDIAIFAIHATLRTDGISSRATLCNRSSVVMALPSQ